jgi:preprotein translocase subunit SecG
VSAIIIFVHVVVCLILIFAVLLQSGKAADLAGAFGGTGSQTEFGSRGQATLLSKVTTISAIVFMLTSLGLWILSAKGTRSVVGNEKAPVETSAPASTAPATPEKKKQEPAAQPPAQKTEQQKPAATTGSEQKK